MMRPVELFIWTFIGWMTLSVPVAAQTLLIESTTVDVEQTVEVRIALDRAPQGLAGFGLRLFLGNEPVADIESFQIHPRFLSVSGPSDIAVDKKSVKLGGLDLDQIRPGETNIELATVVFRGLKSGQSVIDVEVLSLSGDDNKPLNAQVKPGTLTVNGPLEFVDLAIDLDENGNGFIDDDEILFSIELWSTGKLIPGLQNQTIDDIAILKLVELWTKGLPLRQV